MFFLIFSYCTIVYEHFKQYIVLGFVLELWQLNVQRVWVFILVGGGVILIPQHCPRGNVWVLCRPSIDLKDKWRSFPKAFQNYTLRGFFLIRTRFAHFIHNCHDILRQFMIENMQLYVMWFKTGWNRVHLYFIYWFSIFKKSSALR